MANRYSVTLDVNKAKYTINSPIGLREGDSGTATIVATILDNGAAYSGMTSAQLFAQKPDGTAVATDPATVSGNTITYKVTNNLTTASGHIVNAYFLINKSVSTESFEINIQPSITLHGPSTDYIPGLNDLTRVWQQTINEWQGKFDELKAQLENTDYSQVIKDSLNSALDKAKEAYQGEFNAAVVDVNKTVKTLQDKGVEADTEIAKLKTKQDNAETVADSLQATVDQLNKKILDIDKWLDSLHDEFTAKNETYMKSMQAELTKKLADMKASSDNALNTVKGNISTAQSDIDGIDNKIVSLNQVLANVSKSVADINVPQIKADVDAANATANKALTAVDSKADKTALTANYVKKSELNTLVDLTQMTTNKNDIAKLRSDMDATKDPYNIGGRNYLLDTGTSHIIKGLNTDNQNSGGDYYLSVKNTAALFKNTLNATISFDWVATSDATGRFYLQFNDSPWDFPGQASITVDKNHLSGHYSYSFAVPESVRTDHGVASGVCPILDNFVGSITFSNAKLELGTIPTDWAPAPEDYATKDEVAKFKDDLQKYADQKIADLIDGALTSYLKKADLKQANYDAGFHSDWFGTEAQYSNTSHDANVNYHTKEEG
ncbi:BppU family phage baseplate upper protein [Companilactobacillus furfuricola]|uniref:BppU family phage baseplate upper protein n=1 Tax=Companilactobacillus furfuricola TaxID=1462575 RepID=UPI000F7B99E5|nr:BppU family phage baseplate upper protein [Companilactobacillus furfuricola]